MRECRYYEQLEAVNSNKLMWQYPACQFFRISEMISKERRIADFYDLNHYRRPAVFCIAWRVCRVYEGTAKSVKCLEK